MAGSSAEVFEQLQRDHLRIDILVNNAGFGTHGLFVESNIDEQLRMMQLNISTLTHLTRLLLPSMVAQRNGKILNVASTAAFQPGPFMSVYYASKAYVLSFSEALANELRGTGVTVTALCPGPTRTEFQVRAKIGQTKLMNGRIMDAKSVAQIGYQALMQGRSVAIPGIRNNLLALAVRWLPRALVIRAVRSVQEQRSHA